MRRPVSTVNANLYMESFEEKAIATSPYKPRVWKHQEDDTFTVLDCKNIDSFLQHLNNQQPSIHFTMKTEMLQFQENGRSCYGNYRGCAKQLKLNAESQNTTKSTQMWLICGKNEQMKDKPTLYWRSLSTKISIKSYKRSLLKSPFWQHLTNI